MEKKREKNKQTTCHIHVLNVGKIWLLNKNSTPIDASNSFHLEIFEHLFIIIIFPLYIIMPTPHYLRWSCSLNSHE